MIRPAAIILALAAPVAAQQVIETGPLDDGGQGRIILLPEGSQQGQFVTPSVDGAQIAIPDVRANEVQAKSGSGVVLKGLDKVSGDSVDLELPLGQTAQVGRIEVTAGDCRYPEDNPTGEGYAWLTITDPSRQAVLFEGWMVASSPALNALDHPRYDVWVIRCTTA